MEYKRELYHWGVKGQKWGVRRYQNKDGSLTDAGKKRYSSKHEDYVKAHKKKSVKKMSDKELKERNNRLQMEQQYKNLNKRHKTAGEKFVVGVLVASGTAVATKYVTKYMTKAVESFIGS